MPKRTSAAAKRAMRTAIAAGDVADVAAAADVIAVKTASAPDMKRAASRTRAPPKASSRTSRTRTILARLTTRMPTGRLPAKRQGSRKAAKTAAMASGSLAGAVADVVVAGAGGIAVARDLSKPRAPTTIPMVRKSVPKTMFLAAAKPDIYVKGGDYTVATLNQDERRTVEQAGGKIVIIPFVPGKSTTALLKKIMRL